MSPVRKGEGHLGAQDEYDEDLFEYYCTSELIVIDIPSATELCRSPPALYTSSVLASLYERCIGYVYFRFSSSPDSQFLIVSLMERPFSFAFPCGRFPKRIQIWKRYDVFIPGTRSLQRSCTGICRLLKNSPSCHWQMTSPPISTAYEKAPDAYDGGQTRMPLSAGSRLKMKGIPRKMQIPVISLTRWT